MNPLWWSAIALLVGAAFGAFVGWSLGFDLGWNRGTVDMVQKARALAASDREVATLTVEVASLRVELEAIRARRSRAASQAWVTRKDREAKRSLGWTPEEIEAEQRDGFVIAEAPDAAA